MARGLSTAAFLFLTGGIFDYLTEEQNCDLEYGPLEKIAQEGQLMVYKHHGFWACMDTLRDMDYLNGLWEKNQACMEAMVTADFWHGKRVLVTGHTGFKGCLAIALAETLRRSDNRLFLRPSHSAQPV